MIISGSFAAGVSATFEQRTGADRRPRVADLRESGSIEQDADIIAFLHREVVYNKEAPPWAAELLVKKHRAGELGTIDLYFNGPLTRFEQVPVHDRLGPPLDS